MKPSENNSWKLRLGSAKKKQATQKAGCFCFVASALNLFNPTSQKKILDAFNLSYFLTPNSWNLLSSPKTLALTALLHHNYTTPAEFTPVLPTKGHLKPFKSHQPVTAGKLKPVSVVYHM